jgi:Ca2+-binding RTX toxin-like protein
MHIFTMPTMLASPIRKLAVGVLAVVALLAAPSAATSAGNIVVLGARSGSTLTLSVRHGAIVVRGNMAHGNLVGCRFTVRHRAAACPTSRASAIEVEMGGSGDFVRVEERLPVPLVVHLGGGSDKFIGNGERDTCYGGGSRRNRCVGGPGNDICITGNRNSDCVGGPGDDYCRHGDGSDGCWGGPGDDVCVMGPGEDGCHGGPGNDRLYGGAGADQLYGGPGNDYCDGGPGRGKSHGCERGPRH